MTYLRPVKEPDSAPRETTHAVEISGVTCRFGELCALDRISLSIAAGTVVGIVGHNGAGKTTLIDVICGLIRPVSGTVRVLGKNWSDSGVELRASLGVLPQETALYLEVTARQNLRFAAALYGVRHVDRRIAEVLELVGLTNRANDVVGCFSGGMQRRLAIARALLHDPPLLILDEPTVGVDLEARHQIWAHIRSLRAAGRTVVLTTNYLDEAEALCDRVVILKSGKVLAEDTPAALTAQTGRCLELECSQDGAARIRQRMDADPAVLGVESADFGLRIYLAPQRNPEDVVHDARRLCAIKGFRTRSPDLAEVFRALSAREPVR